MMSPTHAILLASFSTERKKVTKSSARFEAVALHQGLNVSL